MRRLPFCACVLTLLAAPASAPAPAAAGHVTGGTAAPSVAGGAVFGQPVKKVRRASRRTSPRPVARSFSVVPNVLDAGVPVTFAFRVDGRSGTVRVRIVLTRVGAAAPAKRLRLGYRRTGVIESYVWTPAAGELAPGDYDVALRAFDGSRRSRPSRVRVRVATPAVPAATGVFPVAGPFELDGDDAVFGAARAGHVHQGHDVTAAEGTPLVAPVSSFVYWVDFQRRGAGHYVVLRSAADGTDYVFMHLRKDSITTTEGAALAAGQQFAEVGSTGSATGPHLHFEIWPDGWYSSKRAKPIDPLPQLIAWAGTR